MGPDPNWSDHHADRNDEGRDNTCETNPKPGPGRFKRSQDGKPVNRQGQDGYDSGYEIQQIVRSQTHSG
jgi:hypothetical protein